MISVFSGSIIKLFSFIKLVVGLAPVLTIDGSISPEEAGLPKKVLHEDVTSKIIAKLKVKSLFRSIVGVLYVSPEVFVSLIF